jgi:uncharacterized protein YidB (DUF937 family)
MGLLDDLAGGLIGKLLGGQGGGNNQLVEMAINMLGSRDTGGLAGLVKAFSQNGLGDIMGSWIGKGDNMPVSSDQIADALGPKLQEIAGKLGLSPEEASEGLAKILPEIINHLTPDGNMPDHNVLSEGLNELRAKLQG